MLPIPLSEIHAYCQLIALPAHERESFMHMICRIDEGFLDMVSENRSKLEEMTKKQPTAAEASNG